MDEAQVDVVNKVLPPPEYMEQTWPHWVVDLERPNSPRIFYWDGEDWSYSWCDFDNATSPDQMHAQGWRYIAPVAPPPT